MPTCPTVGPHWFTPVFIGGGGVYQETGEEFLQSIADVLAPAYIFINASTNKGTNWDNYVDTTIWCIILLCFNMASAHVSTQHI